MVTRSYEEEDFDGVKSYMNHINAEPFISNMRRITITKTKKGKWRISIRSVK